MSARAGARLVGGRVIAGAAVAGGRAIAGAALAGVAVALAVVVAGCSGAVNGASDLSTADLAPAVDLGVRPNVAPPEPRMISMGGPTLASMQLWTLVWAGDETLGAQIDAFHAAVFASSYWAEALGEYGVGRGTARGVLVVPGPRPDTITRNQESAIVEGLIASHVLPDDAETVVDFIVGADVRSFEGQPLDQACMSFSGYHFETTDPPHHPFLVELPCQDPAKRIAVFDNLTWTDSHEMAEAATDPHPATNPGWQLAGHLALEVGDMCNVPALVDLATSDPSADGGARTYTLSRVYSAAAAATGGIDPCAPRPAGPYFNLGLSPSDVVVTTSGNRGSTTVNLVAFSTGAPMPMNWRAFTTGTVTPDRGTNVPGDIIPLTVSAPGVAGQAGSYYFVVEITDPNDPKRAIQNWIGSLTIQ